MRRRAAEGLEWSVRATRDLLSIEAYIAADNPPAAYQVVEHIVRRAELLRAQPFLGPIYGPGRPRKLVLSRYPCSIFYRITATKVRIVRVLHQARRWP